MTRVLALDVGTSSARARVYGADGASLAHVAGRTVYTRTRGHSGRLSEYEPDELVAAAAAAVEEARRGAGGPLDAVAVS
ncbi:MAG TPA: hypothetical protein VML35_05090, partial [Gaiellaceae bacterium]|nr:hypothetical protein [Gaiellaceae bacterium]